MQPFTELLGVAAPLPMANIDTDQLFPARFAKTTERTGLGRALLADLRFDADGRPRTDFVLNDPAYLGASILVVGDNFGCGSSREHAPWALVDFGIRCLISTSFADIFSGNAANNGLLLITLPEQDVGRLMATARTAVPFAVSLNHQTIKTASGLELGFEIDPVRKNRLLNGLDPIGETLKYSDDIARFEENRRLNGAPFAGVAISA